MKSFLAVGISSAIDDTEDRELKIIRLEDLMIGDWKEGELDCNLNK